MKLTPTTFTARLLTLGILFLLYHMQPFLGWTAMNAVTLYVIGTFVRAPARA